jgi:integrase
VSARVATERAQHDVTLNLRGALAPVVSTNHAAIIEPARIGELLRSIECYKGQAVTWYALRIAPFVFVRPGELRHAEWSEFDLDGDDLFPALTTTRRCMSENTINLALRRMGYTNEEMTGHGFSQEEIENRGCLRHQWYGSIGWLEHKKL